MKKLGEKNWGTLLQGKGPNIAKEGRRRKAKGMEYRKRKEKKEREDGMKTR